MTENALDRLLRLWPEPPAEDNPFAKVAHLLDAYGPEVGDGTVVAFATGGVYGPGVRTGLTLGDLRAVLAKARDAGIVQTYTYNVYLRFADEVSVHLKASGFTPAEAEAKVRDLFDPTPVKILETRKL
jgi:hypothetical protein